MFSRFVVTLGRKNVGSLPSSIKIIRKTYSSDPIVRMLEETIGIQRFILGSHGEERCIEKLNDISFQHQFCIKNIDGKMLLWGKKYSISTEWGPTSGLTFSKFIPIRQIYASNLFNQLLRFKMHAETIDMFILLNAWKK